MNHAKQSILFDLLVTIFSGDSQEFDAQADVVEPSLDYTLAQRLPLRILLAEDNVVNQKLALHIFRKMGYTADVATNGKEAVQALTRQDYDIVFMDVQMPEMDGLEATQQIVANWTEEERPKIIAMTANAMQGDRDHCLAAGMDDYISKPIRVQSVQTALEYWGEKTDVFNDTVFQMQTETKPEESNLPLLDESTLSMLRSFGDDFLVEIIEAFLDDAPRQIEAVCQAIQASDADALTKAAHAMKGISLNIGATVLGEACKPLEMKGKNGNLTNLASHLDNMETLYKQTAAELKVLAKL